MSENDEKPTRWDALKSIFLFPERRKKIAHAWPLYSYLIFNMGPENEFLTDYGRLSEEMEEPIPTLKSWKDRLVSEKVIANRQLSHGFAVSLFPPMTHQ